MNTSYSLVMIYNMIKVTIKLIQYTIAALVILYILRQLVTHH